MKLPVLTAIAVAVLAAACAPPAQELVWSPPRTSWGDPLIEGSYTNKDEYGTPLERPDELAGRRLEDFGPAEMVELAEERLQLARATAASIGGTAEEDTGAGPPHWYEHLEAYNSQPWFVIEPVDGKIPAMTEAGRQRQQARRAAFAKSDAPDSYTDMSAYVRCISLGMPGSMMPGVYGNAYEIIQAPGFVAIRHEMIHEARIIPLDGDAHTSDALRSFMGDARGHWEGDTLVVETTNFRASAAYRGASGALKVTERFTPIDADTLRWEVRLEDADTWAAPWAFAMPLKRDASAAVFEYACHEGNLGLRNILSAARAAERAADEP
jgi:hypothetical protein